jgi:hypothetical protein
VCNTRRLHSRILESPEALGMGSQPQIDADLRALIRRISMENPQWGASRVHGELLKLGFEAAQSSVAKYGVKRVITHWTSQRRICSLFQLLGSTCSVSSSSSGWCAEDFVWINVTANLTAEGLYARYYNESKTHRSLNNDAAIHRTIERALVP